MFSLSTIDQLKKVIREELKQSQSQSLEVKTAKREIKSGKEEKKKAAKTILKFWRSSVIIKKIYQQNGYETYLSMLLPSDKDSKIDEEINQLAKLMFGRTVANSSHQKQFPFLNPYLHHSARYYRTDEIQGPLFDLVLKDFVQTPDLTKYLYIPVSMLSSTPINDVINDYLIKHGEVILLSNKSDIGFLRVDGSYLYINKIKATGIIASPWQIAKYCMEKHKDAKSTSSMQPHTLDIGAPKNISLFLKHPCMSALRDLGCSSYPTKYLAQCLFNMLQLLEKMDIDPHVLPLFTRKASAFMPEMDSVDDEIVQLCLIRSRLLLDILFHNANGSAAA